MIHTAVRKLIGFSGQLVFSITLDSDGYSRRELELLSRSLTILYISHNPKPWSRLEASTGDDSCLCGHPISCSNTATFASSTLSPCPVNLAPAPCVSHAAETEWQCSH